MKNPSLRTDTLTDSVMVGQDDVVSTVAPAAPGDDGWFTGTHAGTLRGRQSSQTELRTQWNFRFDIAALTGIDPADINGVTLSIPQIGRLNTTSGSGNAQRFIRSKEPTTAFMC